MTGLEVVVAGLIAYAWKKARRAAGRADAEVDHAMDAGFDRLHDLVSRKLGDDKALTQLDAEAARDTPEPQVSDRTRRRVELALEEAVEADGAFAERLEALVAELRSSGAGPALIAHHTGDATADNGGIAITGVVGGSVHQRR